MRGIYCRDLRLEWVAGALLALALPSFAAATNITTRTTLAVQTSQQSGHTQATAAITVTSLDGEPASGVVTIEDGSRQLAQAVLNGDGQATAVFGLAGGDHSLRAVYTGDASHRASSSVSTELSTQAASSPNFALSLAPVAPSTLPLTLTPGASGTIAVTVTPQDNAALTAPMFITLSCSGLPSLSSCTFTPETIEILASTPTSCSSGSPASACPPVSSMLIQTSEMVTTRVLPAGRLVHSSGPVAWAVLLPGVLGLGGVAWGLRRRHWLQRMALVALIGLVATVGTSACKPLYDYYELGPAHPPATPAGTYTVTVTGQSSNEVTSITNSTTMVLTVQ